MKEMEDYFTATDQLAEFLIHRQGSILRHPVALVFTRNEDAKLSISRLGALRTIQEQISSVRRAALGSN